MFTIYKPLKRAENQVSHDPGVLSLTALGWILQDEDRATRLLSLTGLTPERLRNAVEEPAVQGAILEYLTNYEPDLVRCAEALGVEPAELVAAHAELTR
ncbi:DUF3572 family protein [Altererythrobacter aurantiacus]|uniref:DUF3572 family protein n=1 Tax=Parapontixanthobacter aurantiacus TaxID=1463599 RepID=A0A844ZKG8_9SPHN|nr:DUF3572 domain-containing protein [Parapontixanthobacter aurantiacus]MXO86189.1 DUF3572 family protein [Parapontixanthobacter aurantiacus]